MARTNSALVAQLLSVDPDVSLSGVIDTASALVDALCEPPGVYSDSQLELIERWLAAHFYAIRQDSGDSLTSKEIDGVRETYARRNVGPTSGNNLAYGLRLTSYGQQALVLDYNGYLAFANQKVHSLIRRVTTGWIGPALNEN